MGKNRCVVESCSDGCRIAIRVSPGAKNTEIAGIDSWRNSLKVDVIAPPKEGEANAELIRFLEHIFPEAKGGIRIETGLRSRMKMLFMPLDKGTVEDKLGLRNAD